jgi:anti-anti-sigma factor
MSSVSFSAGAAVGSSVLPPPFACTWRPDGFGSAWIDLTGELDLSNVAHFQEVLYEAQLIARWISIDLEQLSFNDCRAMNTIIDAEASARQKGGWLTLVQGHGQVDRVLGVTGLLDRFEVVDFTSPTSQTANTGS